MKILSRKLFFLFQIGILFSSVQISCQTTSLGEVNGYTSLFRIPPLEQVIDSVLKNNGQLKYRKSSVGIKETNIKSSKIDITKNLGVFAESAYGNFNNFAVNENGQAVNALATTARRFSYNVGVYLKIPLLDFINRKHTINVAKLELDEAKGLVEAQEEIMREKTIRLYQDLISKERMLQIRSKRYGEGKVNMQMVEKEFRNGVVPVAEYVRITNITLELELDYEKGRYEYMLAKTLLEDLAGFKFDIITAN